MSYCQIFFRHTSQKNLIYILTTLALKTNHISNYLLPVWGNVLQNLKGVSYGALYLMNLDLYHPQVFSKLN